MLLLHDRLLCLRVP